MTLDTNEKDFYFRQGDRLQNLQGTVTGYVKEVHVDMGVKCYVLERDDTGDASKERYHLPAASARRAWTLKPDLSKLIQIPADEPTSVDVEAKTPRHWCLHKTGGRGHDCWCDKGVDHARPHACYVEDKDLYIDRVDELVNHPKHYTSHPSGVECIQITEHMGFNLGNAVKYIWRADLKDTAEADLKKAKWYIEREMERRGIK